MMLPLRQNIRELRLPSNGITLLEGPGYFGKDVRVIAQHWATAFLSEGHAIHWLDGSNRFDPTRFFPPYNHAIATLKRVCDDCTLDVDSRFINSMPSSCEFATKLYSRTPR